MSVYLCTPDARDEEPERMPSCTEFAIGAVLLALASIAGWLLAGLRVRRRP